METFLSDVSRAGGITYPNVGRQGTSDVRSGAMMTQTARRVVLFIGTGGERAAADRFAAVARTFGLPWVAECRSLTEPPTAADLEGASVVVGLTPAVEERFPALGGRLETWASSDVEREVMNLVARLLGGKRSAPEPPTTPAAAPARKTGTVRVGRETAGRRGKGVTTVWDLPMTEDEMKELAAALKQRCGTGGTVKDGRIEIQGDHRDRVVAELGKMGYKVKRSGG
jgi:predicted translation initiation factor SUI1